MIYNFLVISILLTAVVASATVAEFKSTTIPDRVYLAKPPPEAQFRIMGSRMGSNETVWLHCSRGDKDMEQYFIFARQFKSTRVWLLDFATRGDINCLVMRGLGPSLQQARLERGTIEWSWDLLGRLGVSMIDLVADFRNAGLIHTKMTPDMIHFGLDGKPGLYVTQLRAIERINTTGPIPIDDIRQVVVSLLYLRNGDKRYFAYEPAVKFPLPRDLPREYRTLLDYVFSSDKPITITYVKEMLEELSKAATGDVPVLPGQPRRLSAGVTDTVSAGGAGTGAGGAGAVSGTREVVDAATGVSVAASARVVFSSTRFRGRQYLVLNPPPPLEKTEYSIAGSILGSDQEVLLQCQNESTAVANFHFFNQFETSRIWIIDIATREHNYCLVSLPLGPSLAEQRTRDGPKEWSWGFIGHLGMSMMKLVEEFRNAGYIHPRMRPDTLRIRLNGGGRLYVPQLHMLKRINPEGPMPIEDIRQVVFSLLYLRNGDKRYFAYDPALRGSLPLPSNLPKEYRALIDYVLSSETKPKSVSIVKAMMDKLSKVGSDGRTVPVAPVSGTTSRAVPKSVATTTTTQPGATAAASVSAQSAVSMIAVGDVTRVRSDESVSTTPEVDVPTAAPGARGYIAQAIRAIIPPTIKGVFGGYF